MKGNKRNVRGGRGHGMGMGGKGEGKEEGEGKAGEGLQPQTSIPGSATVNRGDTR